MEHQPDASVGIDADLLVVESVQLVTSWLEQAAATAPRAERQINERLHDLIADPDGVAFAMRFVDRVIRPEGNAVAAGQLATLVRGRALPSFLSPLDRLRLRVGARLAERLPDLVVPMAQRRMRQLVGHLVVDADTDAMADHLRARSAEGFRLNVNLLGEAVLGQAEADKRLAAAIDLLAQPDVHYVSVKVSAIVAQLNYWDYENSVARVADRLRPLIERAKATDPPTFVNLDMEEYQDLDLTMSVFMQLLDEPALHTVDAGIVLQAYLPDSFQALQELSQWANRRHRRLVDGQPGGRTKIRLVKGANLAMERVEADLNGWEQAPYTTKAETDANYKRCLDWVLRPERTSGLRIGVASHNLFDVAWAHLLSKFRCVGDRVEFEMLQGMAPAQARRVRDETGGMLLYTPIVRPDDFDVAISYLFRRLEENADEHNFLRHLFSIAPNTQAFDTEAGKFSTAVADRWTVSAEPRRKQDRSAPQLPPPRYAPVGRPIDFVNEADTDPALAANRRWAAKLLDQPMDRPKAELLTECEEVDGMVSAAAIGRRQWGARTLKERRSVLHAVGDELAGRRGDLIAAMIHEGSKTIAEADSEVSEAVDFARWYGDCAARLDRSPSADLEPLGVVAVVPPWNFPVAIAAGGTFAALAAGNAVILKPAPSTPRCAEIVAECCWAAGVGDGVQFVRVPDNHLGQHLITNPQVAAVILTGSHETADLFRSWRPDLRIFAETSGKNAMIITPNADVDLAVADLVSSAFGHSGQKCSAASLAICVGEVYESPRFRRQLIDAVQSLAVGPADELRTTVGPLIDRPAPKLERALTQLDGEETWLVEPRRLDGHTWSPGVRLGVRDQSWFHQTECFGPVLGIMAAPDLREALRMQNGTPYGLTGGIHTLDPDEVEYWLGRVEVGNAYVNRPTTGAIVRRQPFGGWKRSVIGPGAKAGGPNYVAQLGRWEPNDLDLSDPVWLTSASVSDARWLADEFAAEHDPTGLEWEANILRYRPLPRVAVRLESDGAERDLSRVLAAAKVCGVPVELSRFDSESADEFAARLTQLDVSRVRVVGSVPPTIRFAANAGEIGVHDDPVTSDGRIELLHYVREQSISRTLHRYGNLV